MRSLSLCGIFILFSLSCSSKKESLVPPQELSEEEISQASASQCPQASQSKWSWIEEARIPSPPLFRVLDLKNCKLERMGSASQPRPLFSGSCRVISANEIEIQGVMSEMVTDSTNPGVWVEENDRSYQSVLRVELEDEKTAQIDGHRFRRDCGLGVPPPPTSD